MINRPDMLFKLMVYFLSIAVYGNNCQTEIKQYHKKYRKWIKDRGISLRNIRFYF